MSKKVLSHTEQEEKKKQGKAKKGKKEYSSAPLEHKYFNKSSVPDDIQTLLQDMLEHAFDVMGVHFVSMHEWCTLEKIRQQVTTCWTISDPIDHKYWWLDKYVDELGYMVYNGIFDKYHNEFWYNHEDDWVDTPAADIISGLSKRNKSSREGVAYSVADEVCNKFLNSYI